MLQLSRELAWLTNEPVQGESLARRLVDGALPAAEALEVALEIGGVLREAHSRGMAHGGVMPERIRLDGGRARLLGPSPASPGQIVTRYSAPEQLSGAAADSRTDIWSFGVVLYEMLCGWPAFHGDTPEELRRAILETEPAALTALTAGRLPVFAGSPYAALERVISGCLAKQPDRRRQRIQNALIELKLIARPLARITPVRPPPVSPISGVPGAVGHPEVPDAAAAVPDAMTCEGSPGVFPESLQSPVVTDAAPPVSESPAAYSESGETGAAVPTVPPGTATGAPPAATDEPAVVVSSAPRLAAPPAPPTDFIAPRPAPVDRQARPILAPDEPAVVAPSAPSLAASPTPPTDFIAPRLVPVDRQARPILKGRLVRREPRLARLLRQLAPTLDEDSTCAAEAAEPQPADSRAASLTVASPAEPAPPAGGPPPPRVRSVEPSPGPAPAADLPSAYRPGEVTYANGLRRRFWILAGLLLLVAVCAAAAIWRLAQRPAPRVFKFAVPPPEHASYPGTPSVSPDGRQLAFSAVGPEGKRMLWLRPLDALHATAVPGTEGGFAPFWSPDSQFIAFFADRSLKKIRAAGGAPQIICEAEEAAGGGTWNAAGVILFAPNLGGGLVRAPAAGGRPEPVTSLNDARRERAHLWPRFLPGGKQFVFYALTDFEETSGVYAGSLEGGPTRRLLTADTNAIYSAATATDAATGISRDGYLLFIRNRQLYRQRFDASHSEVSGAPVLLAEDVGAVRSLGLAPISVSDNGVLVYQTVGTPTKQLLWFDRAGRHLAALGEPGEYGPPRISPDGKSVLVGKIAPGSETADLWLLRTDGSANQITNTPFHEGSPVWSPDGSRFAYFSNQDGDYDIYIRALAGGKAELIARSSAAKYPNDWSSDGRHILYGSLSKDTKSDLWAVGVADRRATPLVQTIHGEGYGSLSPDGKWVAYQSDSDGRVEVYVQAFRPGATGLEPSVRVSTGGGGLPRWRGDGKEIFFITSSGNMMTASVRTDNGIFQSGPATTLFQTRPIPKTWNLYDVTADGERFLVNVPLEWSSAAPITVVTNWTEKLKR